MRANYIQFNSPQFHILSDNQIKELHLATLQVLERTGAAFECQEALDILGDAGVDVSNPDRVKIPSPMVEQALRTTPKMITLYTREGEPAIVLNGMSGPHFGVVPDLPGYLDPYTRKPRQCYIDDIADMVRLIDALPNVEWLLLGTSQPTLPAAITDKVSLLQMILNTSKPIMGEINDAESLREMIDLCAVVAGGEEQFLKKPFFIGSCEPVSPLVHGKDALEKSLLCAGKGLPCVVYGMPMAGAATPATFAGCLAIANAEVLSQLVVLQLKNPGTPVIYGSIPSIMDMRTTIYSYGAPELALMGAALTEVCHHYELPMFGVAGSTDAKTIGVQTGAEVTYEILTSALAGMDMVRSACFVHNARVGSPEMIVLGNEIVDMVNVLMGGIEINDETLPLELIERIGPKGNYISEKHTLKHFRKFWAPRIFDRSATSQENFKHAEDLLNQRTIEVMETHQPKPLPEDLVRELKKIEKTWFDRVGLKHEYPKREER
jgi:trimethylamine--corrinoid protein Co-methyltransferase